MNGFHVVRWQLDVSLTPMEMVRMLGARDRLVALVGDWADGGAIITFDPLCRSRSIEVLGSVPTSAAAVQRRPRPTDETPDIVAGGWFGILGYQLGAALEELPPPPRRDSARADCDLAFYDHVLRYVAESRQWFFEALVLDDEARLRRTYDELASALAALRLDAPVGYSFGDFRSNPSVKDHLHVVTRVIEHVAAGDIFQANACLQLEASFSGDPLDVFVTGVEALRPAYAAFVDADDGAVASFSPELYLERRGGEVRTAPIKGTAPITSDPDLLANSAKERSENVMIVDLMRNDLGRICLPGSVDVSEMAQVRAHAGVWHMVSEVTGQVACDVTDRQIVEKTFPPGSVTGAPKIRAMEVINSLEVVAREVYTGAIGWSGPAGMELNVAIRTFEFNADRARLGVGAGIVADSRPAAEVNECLVKAAPLLKAVGGRLALDVYREFGEVSAPAVRAPAGSQTASPSLLAEDAGPGHAGRIHVLDEHVVVDWGRRPQHDGVHILDLLHRCGLPVQIRPVDADERKRVREEFGFDLLGRSAASDEHSRLAAVGPLQRWMEEALAGVGSEILAAESPLQHQSVAPLSRILLIDNYDSFVFNVAQHLVELGADVEVVRNDRLDLDILVRSTKLWDGVVLSPGPGQPHDAGVSVELIRRLPASLPLLGVCLGHQAIGVAFGAEIVRAPRPVHGQASIVHHDRAGIFVSTEGPVVAGRYHSLVIDERSLGHTPLEITARTPSGLVMGVRHREKPIEGVQFHPESILTPLGRDLLGAFLQSTRKSFGGA